MSLDHLFAGCWCFLFYHSLGLPFNGTVIRRLCSLFIPTDTEKLDHVHEQGHTKKHVLKITEQLYECWTMCDTCWKLVLSPTQVFSRVFIDLITWIRTSIFLHWSKLHTRSQVLLHSMSGAAWMTLEFLAFQIGDLCMDSIFCGRSNF